MSRVSTIISCGTLFLSLALVALSTAIFYLTGHGMRVMDKVYPQGYYYDWYRGPSWDTETKHKVGLIYDSANEYMIFTAGAVSFLAGFVGLVGFFLTRKTNKPTTQKTILCFLILPGALTLIANLIAFQFTFVIYYTNNKGACYWQDGYNPYNLFHCTRELAACNIAGYFTKDDKVIVEIYQTLRRACGDTQTGRHLVAPLFVVSLLMLGAGVAKLVYEKRQNVLVNSADERVERLQRDEE